MLQFFEAWNDSSDAFDDFVVESFVSMIDETGCDTDFADVWFNSTNALTCYIDSVGISSFDMSNFVHERDTCEQYAIYDDFDLKPLFMWCFDIRRIRKRFSKKWT